MPKPIRIILHAAEGNFMLSHDFTNGQDALDFARKVGFSTYEITTDYNDNDWTPLDPKLDPQKVMSFMKRKDTVCQ